MLSVALFEPFCQRKEATTADGAPVPEVGERQSDCVVPERVWQEDLIYNGEFDPGSG